MQVLILATGKLVLFFYLVHRYDFLSLEEGVHVTPSKLEAVPRVQITNGRGNKVSSCTCCKPSDNGSNVACMVNAFDKEQRMRYHELRTELTSHLTTEELPNGFAFFFPNKPLFLQKIAEWVAYENLCCPFIQFTLQVSGELDCIRVELTGSEAVKNLLRQEFSL